jgi:hypothetical protein
VTNSIRAKIAASEPTCPTSGVYAGRFSGAYIVQPPENVVPRKNELRNSSPEIRYTH